MEEVVGGGAAQGPPPPTSALLRNALRGLHVAAQTVQTPLPHPNLNSPGVPMYPQHEAGDDHRPAAQQRRPQLVATVEGGQLSNASRQHNQHYNHVQQRSQPHINRQATHLGQLPATQPPSSQLAQQQGTVQEPTPPLNVPLGSSFTFVDFLRSVAAAQQQQQQQQQQPQQQPQQPQQQPQQRRQQQSYPPPQMPRQQQQQQHKQLKQQQQRGSSQMATQSPATAAAATAADVTDPAPLQRRTPPAPTPSQVGNPSRLQQPYHVVSQQQQLIHPQNAGRKQVVSRGETLQQQQQQQRRQQQGQPQAPDSVTASATAAACLTGTPGSAPAIGMGAAMPNAAFAGSGAASRGGVVTHPPRELTRQMAAASEAASAMVNAAMAAAAASTSAAGAPSLSFPSSSPSPPTLQRNLGPGAGRSIGPPASASRQANRPPGPHQQVPLHNTAPGQSRLTAAASGPQGGLIMTSAGAVQGRPQLAPPQPLMVALPRSLQRSRGLGAALGPSPEGGTHGAKVKDWPESVLLRHVSQGVRIKGVRLASMLDGILDTAVPHLFRVFSTSGMAEWWPVDMAAGLCACPNDADVCSHIFGVCCLLPRYRIRTATLVKARELVRSAAARDSPVDDIVDDLTHCIRRWTEGAAGAAAAATSTTTTTSAAAGPAGRKVPSGLQQQQQQHESDPKSGCGGGGMTMAPAATATAGGVGYGDSADPCRLCAEVAVALLLQGAVESEDVYGPGRRGGQRRRMWWRRAVEASGAPPPPQPLDPPQISRQRLVEEVQKQVTALEAAMEAELAGAAAPAQPAAAPPPRSVMALLLELERTTCAALGIDALSSAESWSGPRSREGGGGGFGRASYGEATVSAPACRGSGGGGGGGGGVSGSEGLLALLAEGGAAMAELFERACGLALALGRQRPNNTTAEQPPAAALPLTPPANADAANASAAAAPEVTPEKLSQYSAARDGGGGILAAAPTSTEAEVTDAAAPVAATTVAAGLEAGVSPLAQQQLAAFCRQALAAVATTTAAAATADAIPSSAPDAVSRSPLADAKVVARVEQLACRQFGAARFTDLVTHGSIAQLLTGKDGSGSGAVAISKPCEQPLFAMALLAGSELLGGGDCDTGDDAEFGLQGGKAACQQRGTPKVDVGLPTYGGYGGADDGSLFLEALSLAAPAASIGTAATDSTAAIVLSYLSSAAALATPGVVVAGEYGSEHTGGVAAWALLASAGSAVSTAAMGGPVLALALPTGVAVGGCSPGALLLVDPGATTSRFAEAVSRLDGVAAVAAMLGMTAGAGSVAVLPLQLLEAVADAAMAQALAVTSTASIASSWSGLTPQEPPRHRGPSFEPDGSSCNISSNDVTGGRNPILPLASYLLDVAVALPPPFLDCQQLLRLLLPPRLRCVVEGKEQQRQGQAVAVAAAAATAAAALPRSVRSRALAALWYLGRRASCRTLCDEVQEALRNSWTAADTATATMPPYGSSSGRSSSIPPAAPPTAPLQGAGESGQLHGSRLALGHAEEKAQDDCVPSAAAAAAAGVGAEEKADDGAGAEAVKTGDGDGGNGDDDDAGSDDIVLVVPKPRHRHPVAAAKALTGVSISVTDTGTTAPSQQPPQQSEVQSQGQPPLSPPLPGWRLRSRVGFLEGRRVIESIRQQEFGVGVSAAPEVAAVLAAQARRLQRALQRLAADLYASRAHLLLELLQNADDCSYPPELAASGEEPRMSVRVGPRGLAVATNEVGFTEADVRALCDVGASSKAAAKQLHQQQEAGLVVDVDVDVEGGQTGEKGIGFKSVFALSDEPAIYSNGFAFGFDAQDPTGLGYVLPRPLDANQDPTINTANSETIAPAVPVPPPTGWGTVILLPAARRLLIPPLLAATAGSTGRSETVMATIPAAVPAGDTDVTGVSDLPGAGSWADLAAGLVAQIRPGILLFLRRVRHLEVMDELAGVRHTLKRVDREEGAVVEITWKVEVLEPPSPTAGEQTILQGGPRQQRVLGVRETVHTWIVGASTLAPPLVTRGSMGTRPPATTVKVALPLPPRSRPGAPQCSRMTAANRVNEAGGTAARVGDRPVTLLTDGSQLGLITGGSSGSSGYGNLGYDDPWVSGCYVYATLPLRPSGLPFDLQADWLVPSSREDISGGEAWNQMLRDQVPAAFLSAVRCAMDLLPDMRRGAWLRYVPYNSNHLELSAIPAFRLLFAPPTGPSNISGNAAAMRNRVNGSGGGGGCRASAVTMPFLRPVVAAVAALLRTVPCILSYSVDGSKGEGELVRPSQVVVGASQELRRLLPSTALAAATGLRYAVTDGLVGLDATLELNAMHGTTATAAAGVTDEQRATEPKCESTVSLHKLSGEAGTSPADGELLSTTSTSPNTVDPDPRVAAVAVELLPATEILSALGLQVFGARHAVAVLQVMLRTGEAHEDGKSIMVQVTTASGAGGSVVHHAQPHTRTLPPVQYQPPLPPQPCSGMLVAAEAAAGGSSLWRWRVLSSLEELLEAAEVQQAHGGVGAGPAFALAIGGVYSLDATATLPALLTALRALPLIPLVGGRAGRAAEALMPPSPPSPPALPQDADGTGAEGDTSCTASAASTGGVMLAAGVAAAAVSSSCGGALGEGGYMYGFEQELPLVDHEGLNAMAAPEHLGHGARPSSFRHSGGSSAAAAAVADAFRRDLALRCLSRLGLTPLQPADVISRHVLPTLRRLQYDSNPRRPAVHPTVLVGYAAYLMHHQHLAARDPRVARQWADALLWVLVPPPATTRTSSTEPHKPQDLPTLPEDPSLEQKRGVGEKEHRQDSERADDGFRNPSDVVHGDGSSGRGDGLMDGTDRWPGSVWAAVPSREGLCLGLSFPGLFASRFPSPAAGAALAALAAACKDAPCALWSAAYLRFGSAARWAEFCGPDVLNCGFTFVRLATVVEHVVGAGGGGGGGGGKVSGDIEALFNHLGVPPVPAASPPRELTPLAGSGKIAQSTAQLAPVLNHGSYTDAVPATAARPVMANLPGLRAIAYLLDALWSSEYDAHAWVASSSSSSSEISEPAGGSQCTTQRRQQIPAPFLQVLRNRAWLPDSWGSCAAPAGGEVLSPSSRPLRSLLGPGARYVAMELTDPRFTAALGLTAAPSMGCVLTQLRQWCRRDVVVATATTEASPSFVTLAGCYSYLSGLVSVEAVGAAAAGVAASDIQATRYLHHAAQLQEDGRMRTDGKSGCERESMLSAIRAAFAQEPLVAVRQANNIKASAAAAEDGGKATTTTMAMMPTLRWCRADEVVWSLGPLAELVSEQDKPSMMMTTWSAQNDGTPSPLPSSSEAAAVAVSAAVALLPVRLSELYPASIESFFEDVLGVQRQPELHHLITALRTAAMAVTAETASAVTAATAVTATTADAVVRNGCAALTCLGWLGWMLLRRPPRRRCSGAGADGESDPVLAAAVDADVCRDVAPDRGGNGGDGARAVPTTPEEEQEQEQEVVMMLEVLKREALLPTVDGRWVAAAAPPPPPLLPLPLDGGTVSRMAAAGGSMREDIVEGLTVVLDIAVAPSRDRQLLLRDPLAAVPGLLRAAVGAGRRLDIVGPPQLPQDVAAGAIQLPGITFGSSGAAAAAAPAAGLRYLLCELLRLPTLGSVAYVSARVMTITPGTAPPEPSWNSMSHMRATAETQASRRPGSQNVRLAVAPVGPPVCLHDEYGRMLLNDDISVGTTATAILAAAGGCSATVVPGIGTALGPGLRRWRGTTTGGKAPLHPSEEGVTDGSLPNLRLQQQLQLHLRQEQEQLEVVAACVLRRLNDVAPYLRRWAAAQGLICSSCNVGGGEGGLTSASPSPRPYDTEGTERICEVGGIHHPATAVASATSTATSSAIAGSNLGSCSCCWTEAAARLRVAAVGGCVGLVYVLPVLGLTTEPQEVEAALLLDTRGGDRPPAGGGEGGRWPVALQHMPSSSDGPLLLISRSTTAAGVVLEPGRWRAVFEELSRLLFSGRRNSACSRFLLLLNTLMEAGQAAEALEASVAALYGTLPRLAPPAPLQPAEEEELCFGAAWRLLLEETNLNPDPGGGRDVAEDPGETPLNIDIDEARGRAKGISAPRPDDDDDDEDDDDDDDDDDGAGRQQRLRSQSRRQPQQPRLPQPQELDFPSEGGARELRRRAAWRAGDGEGVAGGGADGNGGAEQQGIDSAGSLPSPQESRWLENLAIPYQSRGGLGSLAQSSAPSASWSQEVLDIRPELHRSLAGAVTAPLQLPVASEDAPRAAREAVGRWGEQYVAALLRTRLEVGEEVEWVNAQEEQCMPYDLVIRQQDTGEVVSYVEVKATSSWDKTYFEVSHREWLFAQQEGARYHIYRVFGVSGHQPPPQHQNQPRVVRIVNPYLQWRRERVGICLAL